MAVFVHITALLNTARVFLAPSMPNVMAGLVFNSGHSENVMRIGINDVDLFRTW